MKVVNGYEICAQLRRTRLFRTTPIVIVTSSDGVIDRTRAKLVGASDFISKPFSAEGIQEVLDQYLPKAA